MFCVCLFCEWVWLVVCVSISFLSHKPIEHRRALSKRICYQRTRGRKEDLVKERRRKTATQTHTHWHARLFALVSREMTGRRVQKRLLLPFSFFSSLIFFSLTGARRARAAAAVVGGDERDRPDAVCERDGRRCARSVSDSHGKRGSRMSALFSTAVGC